MLQEELKCFLCKSISDYLNIIKKIQSEQDKSIDLLWFRGQSSSSYRLIPSGLRYKQDVMDSRGHVIKDGYRGASSGYTSLLLNLKGMLDEFKQRAIPYLDTYPRSDFEWMFLAQHYGLPTRLLDWTVNPLVAMFFAVNDLDLNEIDLSYLSSTAEYSEQYFDKENRENCIDKNDIEMLRDSAAIFIINPYEINKAFGNGEKVINIIDDDRYEQYINPQDISCYEPLCITSKSIDKRIIAQSGNFTIHGSNLYPLDYYTVTRPFIHKVIIPYENINEIKNELEILGINESFVYPGLDSIAKEIKNKEIKKFPHMVDKFYKNHEE